jgi:transcriptional regulator with XRE-family HTH domain
MGEIGKNVIRNIEDLREQRGLSLRGLSELLGARDRPILPAVLHRLSQGKRRVDADDLMAFALALGVNTNALLLPRNRANDALIELTPSTHQRAWVTWRWADGQVPLPAHEVHKDTEEIDTPWQQQVDFQTYARPHSGVPHVHKALQEAYNLVTRIQNMIEDFGNPDTYDFREHYLMVSVERMSLEVRELLLEARRLAGERGRANVLPQAYGPPLIPGPLGPPPPATGPRLTDTGRGSDTLGPPAVVDPFGERGR